MDFRSVDKHYLFRFRKGELLQKVFVVHMVKKKVTYLYHLIYLKISIRRNTQSALVDLELQKQYY